MLVLVTRGNQMFSETKALSGLRFRQPCIQALTYIRSINIFFAAVSAEQINLFSHFFFFFLFFWSCFLKQPEKAHAHKQRSRLRDLITVLFGLHKIQNEIKWQGPGGYYMKLRCMKFKSFPIKRGLKAVWRLAGWR